MPKAIDNAVRSAALYDYSYGMHHTDIRIKYGLGSGTIYRWLKEEGIHKRNRRYYCNSNYFNEIDTEHKAYFLGFIMADGCIIMDKGFPRFRLKLQLKDIEILQKFKENIDSNHQIYINEKQNYCAIQVIDAEFCNNLFGWGIVPNKTGKETVPNIAENLLLHFWRGIIDGDGSLTYNRKYPRVSLVGSYEIVSLFKLYCSNLFYDKTKLRKITSTFYTYQISGQNAVCVANHLYSDAKIYLSRKHNRYLSWLEKGSRQWMK